MIARLARRRSAVIALLVILVLVLPVNSASSSLLGEHIFRGNSLMFIENVGQFADGARFQVRGVSGVTWLAEEALWITLFRPEAEGQTGASARVALRLRDTTPAPRQGTNIRLSFPGSNRHPRLEPFDRLNTRFSYFLGNDPAQWHPDVPVWGGVRYVDLYPGVDLEITGQQGRLSQRFVTRRGADLRTVRLQIEGADTLALLRPPDARGAESEVLRLTTAIGDFALPLPTADFPFQVEGLLGGGQTAILDARPPAIHRGLEIPVATQLSVDDPGALLYGTFLGGSMHDYGQDLVIDGAGAIYVTGETESVDFPTTPGAADPTLNGLADIFVAKLNPLGGGTTDLVYATFVGGSQNDYGYAIAVNPSGEAYVTGTTSSTDFPNTWSTADPPCLHHGASDAFLVWLSVGGGSLRSSTLVGGSAGETAHALTLDSGYAYVTGQTDSGDYPITPDALDSVLGDGGWPPLSDAFVTKLDPAHSGCEPRYGTFLGGSDGETGYGIVTRGNTIYLAGHTSSGDFPVTPGAFRTSHNQGGFNDGFLAKLTTTSIGQSDLTYSTFLGWESGEARDVVVDPVGAAYLTGIRSYGCDSFVITLNPAGLGSADLVYSTNLGGTISSAIALDYGGNVYVAGALPGGPCSFPVTANAFDTSYGGNGDLFVTRLHPNSGGLLALDYSSYLGGSGSDRCDGYHCGLAVDSAGVVYTAGSTGGEGFPTTAGAYDTSANGYYDAYVTKLLLPPHASVSRHGDQVVLTWLAASPYTSYEIWRDTNPYFDLIFPPATLLTSGLPPDGCVLNDGVITCVLSGGIGDSDTNYFYVVRGLRSDGSGADSNRTGEFDFTLRPGG